MRGSKNCQTFDDQLSDILIYTKIQCLAKVHVYPYLGQLEFRSGAFILLIDVTTLWVDLPVANSTEWVWFGKAHVLIKGLLADNAYQSTNQALRSKELPVELRNRFLSSHTSGEEFQKLASLKGHRSMQSLLPLMEEVWNNQDSS